MSRPSGALCRLSTGGGFATRQLYTDSEEVLFDAVRPIVLNGIEDMISRPDLADRAIFLSLEPIRETRRRTERELWQWFRRECPEILGALLSAAVRGLDALPTTTFVRLPRMADFAQWVSACEGGLWPVGSFAQAYRLNRQRAVRDLVEADPLANAVRRFMAARTTWMGTATDLLKLLDSDGATSKGNAAWLESPRVLAGRVRRAAAFLRELGIDVAFARSGRSRTRVIILTRTGGSS